MMRWFDCQSPINQLKKKNPQISSNPTLNLDTTLQHWGENGRDSHAKLKRGKELRKQVDRPLKKKSSFPELCTGSEVN